MKHDFPKTSAPALRALANAKIRKLNQLTKYTEADIAKLHGMGPKAIGILKAELKKRKLSFKK